MLSLYRPPREDSSSSSSSSSSDERIIPAGVPYLTKINGKLVFARQKKDKPINVVNDLLGEAFASRARIVRRRAKSVERKPGKMIVGGVEYVPQQQLIYSNPLPQMAFPSNMLPAPQYGGQYIQQPTPSLQNIYYQPPPQQYPAQPTAQPPGQPQNIYYPPPPHQRPAQPPPLWVQPKPTDEDIELLKRFDAHFKLMNVVKLQPERISSASTVVSDEPPLKPGKSRDTTQGKEKEKSKPIPNESGKDNGQGTGKGKKGKGKGSESEKENEEAVEKPEGKQQTHQGKEDKVNIVEVAVVIDRHVCGDCGRLRSRKYHHLHPNKKGEIPPIAFCWKCQKDASSTSDASSLKQRRKKKEPEGKVKKNNKSEKPIDSSNVDSGDDDDKGSSSSPVTKPKPPKKPGPTQPVKQQYKVKPIPADEEVPYDEDVIVVEEEISESDLEAMLRRETASKGHAKRGRESSPSEYPPRQEPGPILKDKRNQRSEHTNTSVKTQHNSYKEPTRQESPSVEYRYVEVVPRLESFEITESYPRKIPVRYVHETISDLTQPLKHHHQADHSERHRLSVIQSVGEPDSTEIASALNHMPEMRETPIRGSPVIAQRFQNRRRPSRASASKNHGFKAELALERTPVSKEDSIGSVSSAKSAESRHRRRRERASAASPVLPPWEEPHVIQRGKGNDLIVVTETFEYRPKKRSGSEEGHARQELIDRATLSPRTQSNQFSPEEAAKYYHEDWSNTELAPISEQPPRKETANRGYRRDRIPDSIETESVASHRHQEADPHRVPTQISPRILSAIEQWEKELPPLPFPRSTDSSPVSQTQGKDNRTHMPHAEIPRDRGRGESRSRSYSRSCRPSKDRHSHLHESTNRNNSRSQSPFRPQRGHSRESRNRSNPRSESPPKNRGGHIREPASDDAWTERAIVLSPRDMHGQDRENLDRISEVNLTEMEARAEEEAKHAEFLDTQEARNAEYPDIDYSEIERKAERDAEARFELEAEGRRVRFRETPSVRSAEQDSWSPGKKAEMGDEKERWTGGGGGGGWEIAGGGGGHAGVEW